MKSIEDVKKFYQNAAMETNPKRDEIFLKKLLVAHEIQMNTDSAAVEPNIRRIIMKSPITKFAAAGVIITAVTLGLFEFSGTGNTSSVAWGQILEKTEQIPAVVFDMTVEIEQPGGENLVLPSRYYVAGDYGTRSDVYIDGKLSRLGYRLPTQKVAYQINVDQKKYWRFELSDEGAAQGQDPDDPRTWLKMILSGGGYTELGRAEINGVAVEGIEGNRTETTGENCVMRVWVDVKTNLPVQIVMETLGMEGGQMKRHKYVMENFDWDASLDESIFEPNIPDDFVLGEDPRASRNRQESSKAQSAPLQTLTEQEKSLQPKIKETVRQFLQACSDGKWDEILKYRPGFEKLSVEQRVSLGNQLGGLEIMEIDEPFKTDSSGVWHIPCRIKWKTGEDNDEIRVRHDETLGIFVVCGGP